MDDSALRAHLLELLQMGHGHLKPEAAFKGLPFELWGERPDPGPPTGAPDARSLRGGVGARSAALGWGGAPHTPWELLEHLRITQWDILDFSRNPKYAEPKWPEEYWPRKDAPDNPAALAKSLDRFHDDLLAMQALVKDPKTDLFAKIPWGHGQTILREAMLVADHNAYHLGQFVLVRRLLGKPPSA